MSGHEMSGSMGLEKLFAPYLGNEATEKELERSLVGVSKLLSLPYADFLSAMTESSIVKKFLLSFLQNKARVWEATGVDGHEERGERGKLSDHLARGVFTLYYRVFFDLSAVEDHLKKICKVNTLLTAPDVIDLCSIYGPINMKGLRDMLVPLFKVNPSLLQELVHCCKEGLDELILGTRKRVTLETIDVILTLQCFYVISEETEIVVVQGARQSSVSISGMLLAYGGLKEFLDVNDYKFETEVLTALLDLLHVTFLAKYFIAADLLLQSEEHLRERVSSSTPSAPRANPLQELTDKLMSSIQDPETGESVAAYLADYDSLYELCARAEPTLTSNSPEMDGYRENLQYLVGVIQVSENSATSLGQRFTEVSQVEGSTELQPDKSATEALVQSIKDILPHLGSYFITQLLEHSEYNAERAVQMVLENNLPGPLAQLDFALETPPVGQDNHANPAGSTGQGSLEQKPQGPSSSAETFNAFAKDEFEEEEDEESRALKEKIRAAALKYSEYDDEYDDAYEDIDFDVGDNKGGEAREWKPGMVDIDGKKRDKDGKEIKEDPDDMLKPNLNRKKQVKKDGQDADQDSKKPPRQSGDPVDAKTARFKSKNKSRIGNHSRKRGAAKKQSKGMF